MTDEPGEDAIDGIKVDPEGSLYVCGPGRHLGALARRASSSS